MPQVWGLGCAVATTLMSHQILRVIFKQKDLKRASGRKGQLQAATLHPDAAPVRFPVMDLTFSDVRSDSGTPRYTLTKTVASPITRSRW